MRFFAAYGSKAKITEIKKNWHGIRFEGNFNPGYTLTISTPVTLSIGLGKIVLDNIKTIKGLAQAIDSLCKTLDSLAKNVGKDIKELFQKYDERHPQTNS